MTSLAWHGWPTALWPVLVPVSVTNLSMFPPLNAFCSAEYPWSWSQVRMSAMLAGSRRRGLTWWPAASWLGLLVSRFPTPPTPGLLARLFTFGVPLAARNGWPEVLAALG